MPSSEIAQRHLRLARDALGEDERDLLDARAGEVGELRRLDLEGVAGAEHLVDVDRRQRVARQSLKPPLRSSNGRPSASREALQPTRLSASRVRAPAVGAAAGQVALAEHEVGVALVQHGEHLGELLRRVGEVAVHLADDRVAARPGTSAKPAR